MSNSPSSDAAGFIGTFIKEAREYCLLMENYNSLSSEDFMSHLIHVLTELYAAALNLPDVYDKIHESDLAVDAGTIHRDNTTPFPELHKKFGDLNYYRAKFDPFKDNGPIGRSFSYDLTEVYWPLKQGFTTLELGSESHFWLVAYHWRDGFCFVWGRYLVTALWGLHWLVTDRGLGKIGPVAFGRAF